MPRDKKTRDRLLQEQGAIRERWISNTERLVFCPTSKSDFTFENVDENYWDINSHPDGLPNGIKLSDMQAMMMSVPGFLKFPRQLTSIAFLFLRCGTSSWLMLASMARRSS